MEVSGRHQLSGVELQWTRLYLSNGWPGHQLGSLFYIVNDSWSFQQPVGALAAVSIPNNAVEIRPPKSMFASTNLKFELMAANGWSDYTNNRGGTWDIGGSSISNAIDVVTDVSGNTWNEVKDGVVDYYADINISQVPFFSELLLPAVVLLGLVVLFRRA